MLVAYHKPTWMLKTSSTGMEKGLSSARAGSGMYVSTASISLRIASLPISGFSPFKAARAEPRTMGMSSPGYLSPVKERMRHASLAWQ